jgi:hypothetical protein
LLKGVSSFKEFPLQLSKNDEFSLSLIVVDLVIWF